MDKLKQMKEALVCCAQGQINGNLRDVDAKELGEVIDMVKDLEEAIYYCTITKAMEENDHHKETRTEHHYYTVPYYNYPQKYRDTDREYGKMYYDGRPTEQDYMRDNNHYPTEIRDYREGRSPMSRRTYMEQKEQHMDTQTKLKELEKYLKELSEDITEMISDATPEEKTMLSQKLSVLASKVK